MRSNSPSATAELVAKGMLSLSPELSLQDSQRSYFERCVQECDPLFLWLNRQGWYRWLFSLGEHFTIPGIRSQYLLRKWWIWKTARELLDQGHITQLVILGAGYDPLGHLLAERYPKLSVFELDHPATQRVKVRALKNEVQDNLHFSPIDLTRESLEERLSANGFFERGEPSLFISEALTMYLPDRRVQALFADISALSAPQSNVLFTFLEKASRRSPRFVEQKVLVNLWLRFKQEPFRWSLAIEQLEDFLLPFGFTSVKHLSAASLQSLFLDANGFEVAKPPHGEHICLIRAGGDD